MDLFNAVEIDPSSAEKALKHLEKIKASQADTPELARNVQAALKEFNQFFLGYGMPYFTAHELQTNEAPESAIYNENVETLAEDIGRLYESVALGAQSALTSYNFAAMVSSEIKNAAELGASKVLDLNILNNFVKGTTIVAGDDFIDSEKVDSEYGVEGQRAEFVQGASAMGLYPVGVQQVSNLDTKISVTPVMPANAAGVVNVNPTPQNLERFYEGLYYAAIGDQRPEGGYLDLTYFADPSAIPASVDETVDSNGNVLGSTVDQDGDGVSEDTDPVSPSDVQKLAAGGVGFFAVLPASDANKEAKRKAMLDGNPDTFWECEFVYATEPLIDPFTVDSENLIIESTLTSPDSQEEVVDG